MPKGKSINNEGTQGKTILSALHTILKRCDEAGVRLGYPGEGGERAFRGWLVSDLLTKVLGWPAAKVVVGERFDILLQDADGFPICTIETKTPYHTANKKEREDFEKRLSGFGTLRTAYFTNGVEWERLDIFAPTGALEIRGRAKFNLDDVTPEQAEAFFAPLAADRYLVTAPRASRHAVSRGNSHILEALAADLHQAIGDVAFFLESLLLGIREGYCGEQTRNVALSLFNLWCEKSLVVSPRQAAARLVARFKKADLTARELETAVTELGFTGSLAIVATEALVSLPKAERLKTAAVADALWAAYAATVRNFSIQTAHVLLARALLYRIGEDQGVFPRVLSGEEMQKVLLTPAPKVVAAPKPATELLSRVRQSMQGFQPTIYMLGEFDWWLVTDEKRASLKAAQSFWLRSKDEEFERVAQRLLRLLDGYFFGRVDVDVWRNVYQHYLPADERQRLGGFYTPDELVNLVLDLCGFLPEHEGLCELSFMDMASGSGAFVTGGLARLLKHLELHLPCHAHLHKRGLPDWKRAEAVLNIVAKNLHAVDIHPFAAFLTTLNVLFLLMSLYVKAREKNPDFSLDLQIFSADSLEKHDKDRLAPELFATLNSRIQLTEDSFRRFQEMLHKRFDRLFGNPPWGGVLKGPLAPVYDNAQKERFKHEYRAAAQGKYDIYGLFMERALQVLNPNGRFGLLTQGSFIDKDWAAGLREMLATKTELQYIVDLNPFGQLFFHAMNIPCITVADMVRDRDLEGDCISLLSRPPEDFKALSELERRERVVTSVSEAIGKVAKSEKPVTVGFATAARIPRRQLKDTADDRWYLSGVSIVKPGDEDWATAGQILHASQGVTVGGKHCLGLFLLTAQHAKDLGLESSLVHPVIKGRETIRWKLPPHDHVMLYPYDVSENTAMPAFTLDLGKVDDEEMRESLRKSAIQDALDFDRQLDRYEQAIHRKGINSYTASQILKHRQALNLVAHPKTAAYLVEHYEQLEGRIFEQRNIRDWGKRWYEYHRPRDPRIMLATPKLISPRLAKEVRFALDTAGIVPQDSCICLALKSEGDHHTQKLRKELTAALGHNATVEDVLKYCLAILNNDYTQHRFVTGHRPRPGEVYAVTEDLLKEIPIPPPTKKAADKILSLVTQLLAAKDGKATSDLEKALADVVNSLLKS